ncbi:YdeI/OmpD-associated family protein [Devosia sp. PTR5]|uniref:YdeI/OmpD-associated family protein n=1 Tax=Devosia oryzisoli TaxID=2774138 RepID=A0A927FU23_9HYPH|nr:YdeI/OmpD-associated family protein [Devosia oryzisoli]MBD8066305.1 YdeI/OmpD-associated family protein [Devosia oryzisoli]
MAPVTVPSDRVREFVDFAAFYDWLAVHHASEPEVWIRIFKKASGRPTISPVEAIDAVLCWGWIDAIKKSWDDVSFVQRYCPRKPRSAWSQVNRDNVDRLVQAGLMTEHGLRHVDAAKADGRWDQAYRTTMDPPADLLTAIAASPAAQATYDTLSAQNRFALTFRVIALKTQAARQRKIESFVAMLERGETIYPQTRREKAS